MVKKKTINRRTPLTKEQIDAVIAEGNEDVINDDNIAKARKIVIKHSDDKKNVNDGEAWWNKPMEKDKFIIKKINEHYYVRYNEWSENIWTGPYETRKESNGIVTMYVNETKKPVMERKINNIHSIIINDLK